MSIVQPVMPHSESSTASIRIHSIQTGWVRVRSRQIEGEGHGSLRILRTFVDREWSDWLPILAWVIEHPEGIIVVDTGETARTGQAGYLPSWHPYYRFGVEFHVEPNDEIGPQLRNLWIHPSEVRTVVMTHLHTDHAGGLGHFPDSEVLVHRNAFQAAQGYLGRLRGYLPNRWPERFAPRLVDFVPEPLGPFNESYPVTRSRDVLMLPTPGHTPDHVSVAVRANGKLYFLAGDSSYNQELMLAGRVDGLAPNDEIARTSLSRIRSLAESEPMVYLPSHDPDSQRRIASSDVVNVGGRSEHS